MVAKVVFRAGNRIFVGLPFCTFSPTAPLLLHTLTLRPDLCTEPGRNDEFMDINIEHASNLLKVHYIVESFPLFLRE